MPKRTLLVLLLLSLAAAPGPAFGQAASAKVPAVDDLLNIKTVGSPQLSPDGTWVAYTVSSTDWKQDAFVTQVWLAHVPSGRSFQATRGEKSCFSPAWSPDGGWLAFTSSRVGDKNQIFAIRPDGGEAIQLTSAENGVGGYAWSNDGKQIAFTTSDLVEKDVKSRKDYVGDFEVVRREYAHQHLRTIVVAEAMNAPVAGTGRTRGRDYSVSSASWSPDNRRIAFSATINPDLIQGGTSDI
jgi:dipeptidyl aminopeptidase/acylaminoacyl peptidase